MKTTLKLLHLTI